MTITWKGAHSNNYTPGRAGKPVQYIVLHWIVGTLQSADATFANPNRQASAHYGIGKTAIHQYVSETDTAWHCGNFDFNQRSIGIEHQGGPDLPIDELTYKTSAKLVADIAKRHGITLNRTTVRGHREISSTQCPGTLDIDRIIRDANALLGGTPPQAGGGSMVEVEASKFEELVTKSSKYDELAPLYEDLKRQFDENNHTKDRTIEHLNEALTTKDGEIKTLTAEKTTLEAQLGEAIKQRETFEVEASRVPELEQQLKETTESRTLAWDEVDRIKKDCDRRIAEANTAKQHAIDNAPHAFWLWLTSRLRGGDK